MAGAPDDVMEWWAWLGIAGTAIFGSRFFVQWVASERAGKSVVPRVFWHISILGSLVMLVYALFSAHKMGWKNGIGLILAYAPNCIVYVRNLMLLDRHEKMLAPRVAPAPAQAVTSTEEEASTHA